MAVYRGLDILSAKPTDVMQAQVKYLGIDIAEPDQNFSVVDYLNYLLDIDFPKMTLENIILPFQWLRQVSTRTVRRLNP